MKTKGQFPMFRRALYAVILFGLFFFIFGLGNLPVVSAQGGDSDTPEPEARLTPTPTPEPDSVIPTPEVEAQIVGGAPADAGEYPWQVALVDGASADLYNTQFCGGSLIDPQWALTAAHCITEDDGSVSLASSLDVVAGIYNLQTPADGYQRRDVIQIIRHSAYNDITYDNDIALLKLSSPITIGGSGETKTAVIPLVSSSVGSLAGANSWVTGWGNTSTTSTPSWPTQLQEVQLPIISNSVCNDASHYNGGITANMLCAGYDAGGQDSCQGDSGGPMIVQNAGQWNLAGVVSWGDGCAQPYRQGVYTRVSQYVNWINSNMSGIIYTVSGNAGVGGATLTYGGGSTIADGSGNYSFTVSPGWSGTVRPSKAGYVFSPASKTYNIVTSNQISQNYTASASVTTLIQDPSFEGYSFSPWSQYSTNYGTPLCTVADCGTGGGTAGPRSGEVWGWFGGTTAHEDALLYQNVTIPSGHPNLRLKFYFWIGAANYGSNASDIFVASVDGTTVFSANATQKGSYPAYTPIIVDVSAFSDGASHTIAFASSTSGQIVNFNVDDVSLVDAAGPAILISPIGSIDANYNPTYTWSREATTTHYHLYVGGPSGKVHDQWYEAANICDDTTCAVNPGPSAALTGGSYSWYVQTYNSVGNGPWSNNTQPTTFTVTPPSAPSAATLTYPAQGQNIGENLTPNYTWNQVDAATWYQVYIGGSGGAVHDQWYQASAVCGASTCSVNPSAALTGGSYSWYVRTYGAGGYGPWSNNTQPTTFTVTLPAAPGATTLTYPAQGQNIGTDFTPTYTWNKVNDATWYRVYVGGPSGAVHDKWYQASVVCGASTCSINPNVTLGVGNYSWYVQTYGAGEYGPWSNNTQPTNFSTTATSAPGMPVLTYPAQGQDIGANYTPAYTWDKVDTAAWYRVYISGPSGVVLDQWYQASVVCGASTCSITPTVTLGGGTYSWYVQAWNPGGYGPWSNNTQSTNFTTTVLVATLTYPAQGQNIGTDFTPTYEWDKVESVTWYRVYVSGPGGVVLDKWYQASAVCGAFTCSINPNVTLGVGNYSWNVQTYSAGGYGSWSNNTQPTNFSTTAASLPGAPVLVYPANGQNIGINYTPTYTWNKINSAAWYRVYVTHIANVGGSAAMVLDQWYQGSVVCGASTCSVTPSVTLPGSGALFWYVQAWNPAGYGPWSNPSNFITNGQTAPIGAVLIEPTGTIAALNPSYTWYKVSMATWYRLYVKGPYGVVQDQWYQAVNICGTTTCSVTSPTLTSGNHTWWVQTYNVTGYGPWKSAAFTVSP